MCELLCVWIDTTPFKWTFKGKNYKWLQIDLVGIKVFTKKVQIYFYLKF